MGGTRGCAQDLGQFWVLCSQRPDTPCACPSKPMERARTPRGGCAAPPTPTPSYGGTPTPPASSLPLRPTAMHPGGLRMRALLAAAPPGSSPFRTRAARQNDGHVGNARSIHPPPPSPQAAEQSMTNAPRVWSWRGLRLQPLPAQEQRCGAASADTRRSPALHGGHWALTGTVPPRAGSPPTVGLLLPARGSPPCLGRGLASQAPAVPPRSPPRVGVQDTFTAQKGRAQPSFWPPPGEEVLRTSAVTTAPWPGTAPHPASPPNSS